MVATKASPGAPSRPRHPALPALVDGLDLSPTALESRPDAEAVRPLAQLLANAEYWLSFDLASFEPMLARCPSPLRELGVAVLLKFNDDVGGRLHNADVERAETEIAADLPDDLRAGVQSGLRSLAAAVRCRDAREARIAEGYKPYTKDAGMNVAALRAMGTARIEIEGVDDRDKAPVVRVGEPVTLRAFDERGRPAAAPEIESGVGAELLVRDADGARTVVWQTPGAYRLRVPGKAAGDRKILAR